MRNLDYDLSGALDPRRFDFPALDNWAIFYRPAKGIIIPNSIEDSLNDVAEEFFYRTTRLPAERWLYPKHHHLTFRIRR